MADLPGEDLLALRKKLAPKTGSAAQKRHAADRKSMLSENDGRRIKSGITRNAQINFKIPSETKARIIDIAREMGKPMVWVLEHGLELIEAEAKAKRSVK